MKVMPMSGSLGDRRASVSVEPSDTVATLKERISFVSC